MSYFSSLNVQCERIQETLETQFNTCTTPMENMAALESILSTQKAQGIKQSVVNDNGKVKTVRVTYEQRALESSVTAGYGERACVNDNRTTNNFTDYSLDPTYAIKYGENFFVSEMATICTDDLPSFFAKKLQKIIDVIERKIATQTVNELLALYGKWGSTVSNSATINGSDELVVSTFLPSTKNIDYTALTTLDLAFMKTGYCNNPIILAGSTMWAYGQHIKAGCCSTSGVNILDLANQHGQAIVYDKRLEAAFGSPHKSIAFQPGSVALIWYNAYNPTDVLNAGANYSMFKAYGPRTGLPIDIIVKDDCGRIFITGYANTKLVGLPTDMFAVGDEYRGVTFVNKILVTNT